MQTYISKGTLVNWFDPKLACPSPKNINKGKTVDISRRWLLPSTNRRSGSFNKLLNPTKIQLGLAKGIGVSDRARHWVDLGKKEATQVQTFLFRELAASPLPVSRRCRPLRSHQLRAQSTTRVIDVALWQENSPWKKKQFQHVENIEHLHSC